LARFDAQRGALCVRALVARAQGAATAIATLVLLAGHFAPWAAHFTAALTRSAHELSVSTNFTPGAGVFWNEWFLLPLWSAAVLIALLASGPPKRWLGLGLSWLVASLGLPAYPHLLTAYAHPDYRLQFFITLAIFGVAFVLGHALSASLHTAVLFICALASAVPLAGYFMVKPAIEALYQGEIGIGVGWWLTLAGVGMLLLQVLRSWREAHAPPR
jgi:hypothetical protein